MARSAQAARAGWLASLVLAPSLACAAAGPAAAADGLRLSPGRPVARQLAAGETDVYSIVLDEPGRWRFRLTVEGNTASFTAADAGGAALLSFTSLRGLGWEDALLVPVAAVGEYHLEVTAEHRGAPVGKYQLLVEKERGAAPAEAAQAAADAARTAAAAFWSARKGDENAVLEELEAAAEGLARFGLLRAEIRAWVTFSAFAMDHHPARAELAATRGIRLAERLGADPLGAQALEQRGMVRQMRGDPAAARGDFAAAVEIWERLGVELGVLRGRANVAALLVRSGRWEEARALLAALLPRLEASGERRLAGALSINLGGAYAALGDSEPAVASLRQARALADELDDRRLAAQARNDLGVLLRRLGENGDALAELQAALEVFRQLGDRLWQARVLNNLGLCYLGLGAPSRAATALAEALELRLASGDRAGQATTLKNLARLALENGETERAGELAEQALALDRALASVRGEAASWRIVGAVRARRGQMPEAREAFDLSLSLSRQLDDRAGVAQTLLARGELTASPPLSASARADLDSALAAAGELGDRVLEVAARVALARLDRQAGNPAAAERGLTAALETVESLRTAIADPVQRSTFLASRSRVYELLIAVLLDRAAREPSAGHAERALEIAEKAQARILLDWLEAPAAGLDAGLPPALGERLKAARRQVNAKAQRLLELLAAGQGQSARTALGEVHAALAALEAARAEVGRVRPEWAGLAGGETLSAGGIRALIDADAALLQFALGEEGSVRWEVRRDRIAFRRLPPRREIEELAREAARDLSRLDLRQRATRRDRAAALSRLLFGDLGSGLCPGGKLALVPDGALHLLPFAALPLPGGERELLIDRCEITQLPSSSALAVQRRLAAGRPLPGGSLAVFADPVFAPDDPRLDGLADGKAAGWLPGYGRLPASREEAEAILALTPAAAGKLAALGFDASREIFEGIGRGAGAPAGYRILHFATHGVSAPERPELTGILLSQFGADGRPKSGLLVLQDLLGRRLGAELVVLSGCRTALGEEIAGEGPVGLARGFLYAGARRVMSSLWPVEDLATRELMVRFYRAHFAGRPAAAALREAQLGLRADPRFADPYFWGAFVLVGDGR